MKIIIEIREGNLIGIYTPNSGAITECYVIDWDNISQGDESSIYGVYDVDVIPFEEFNIMLDEAEKERIYQLELNKENGI